MKETDYRFHAQCGVPLPPIVYTLEPRIAPWSIGLSLFISVGAGVIFGLYPARKAAMMDPIEARVGFRRSYRAHRVTPKPNAAQLAALGTAYSDDIVSVGSSNNIVRTAVKKRPIRTRFLLIWSEEFPGNPLLNLSFTKGFQVEWRQEMTTNIVVRDESMSGETLREFTVELPSETVTVRELIRSRIYQEVKESNAKAASVGLEPKTRVPLSDKEVALNGPAAKSPAPIDWQTQFENAVRAFSTNQIMVFVDNRQAHSLEESVEICSATKISFLRLTMLMGG